MPRKTESFWSTTKYI